LRVVAGAGGDPKSLVEAIASIYPVAKDVMEKLKQYKKRSLLRSSRPS